MEYNKNSLEYMIRLIKEDTRKEVEKRLESRIIGVSRREEKINTSELEWIEKRRTTLNSEIEKLEEKKKKLEVFCEEYKYLSEYFGNIKSIFTEKTGLGHISVDTYSMGNKYIMYIKEKNVCLLSYGNEWKTNEIHYNGLNDYNKEIKSDILKKLSSLKYFTPEEVSRIVENRFNVALIKKILDM